MSDNHDDDDDEKRTKILNDAIAAWFPADRFSNPAAKTIRSEALRARIWRGLKRFKAERRAETIARVDALVAQLCAVGRKGTERNVTRSDMLRMVILLGLEVEAERSKTPVY